MTLSVMLIPAMHSLFELAALNSLQWWMVLVCSVVALFLSDLIYIVPLLLFLCRRFSGVILRFALFFRVKTPHETMRIR